MQGQNDMPQQPSVKVEGLPVFCCVLPPSLPPALPAWPPTRKEDDEEEGGTSCECALEELGVEEGKGGVAGGEEHEVAVGGFEGEGGGGPDVHEELEEDDLEGGEGEGG